MPVQQKNIAREGEIKAALLNDLQNHQLVLPEFIYADGKRRADIMAFDKDFYAFEIKSDADSLVRLQGQLTDYLKIFDYVFCVTTEKYLRAVIATIPARVGVYKFDKGELTEIRAAKLNKSTRNYSMLTLLNSRELDILSRKCGYVTYKLDIHSKRQLLSRKLRKPIISAYLKEHYAEKSISSSALSAA
jgi:hypothetical protein